MEKINIKEVKNKTLLSATYIVHIVVGQPKQRVRDIQNKEGIKDNFLTLFRGFALYAEFAVRWQS